VALTNLASNAANEARAVAGGGLAAVLAALEAHPDSAAVSEEACAAVANLSFAPAHHAAALAAGARAAVAAARARHALVRTAVAQADYVLAALDAAPEEDEEQQLGGQS
jgi:hypothetical protein